MTPVHGEAAQAWLAEAARGDLAEYGPDHAYLGDLPPGHPDADPFALLDGHRRRAAHLPRQASRRAMTEIPRDRWKRPLIIPPNGGDPIAYTRVSTLAKTLDDLNMLMAWQCRKTAEGLLRRPDLMTRLAGVLANGDPDTDYATKRLVNHVTTEAREAAGASKGSSAGTGFHALTEAIDRGMEPLFVPESDKPRLEAYRRATAGHEMLDIETFVVADDVRGAGTFDRLIRCPDGKVRVGDLKSGKSEADYPFSTTLQLAIYAHGKRYDPATGKRTWLHPDLDLREGLLIHLPATGGCRLITLDLEKGWRAARAADVVHHEFRKWRASDLILADDLGGVA